MTSTAVWMESLMTVRFAAEVLTSATATSVAVIDPREVAVAAAAASVWVRMVAITTILAATTRRSMSSAVTLVVAASQSRYASRAEASKLSGVASKAAENVATDWRT